VRKKSVQLNSKTSLKDPGEKRAKGLNRYLKRKINQWPQVPTTTDHKDSTKQVALECDATSQLTVLVTEWRKGALVH
jgi:hypothetical protein